MVEAALLPSLRQSHAAVRFEWGMAGARHLVVEATCEDGPATAVAPPSATAGAVVVVDTLSFTTAVSVATGRGTAVVPCDMNDTAAAAELAVVFGAELAVARRDLSAAHPWSLSPRSLLEAPRVARLVLPSPNGSTILASLQRGAPGCTLVAGCLRNATATARWLIDHGYGQPGAPVTVLAAGERWPDGSLRAAVEDVLAAGAIIERLGERFGASALSVEARATVPPFAQVATHVGALADCASGRELAAMGFPTEVEVAGAVDADQHASVVRDGMLVPA